MQPRPLSVQNKFHGRIEFGVFFSRCIKKKYENERDNAS